MTTPAPPKLNLGDRVKDQFIVRKKLGEGACGSVYLVQSIKHKMYAAMKIEAVQRDKDDEILKMEVYVIKRLQASKHCCRLLMSGKTATFNFVVMSLLGKELGELRRRQPDRKFSLGTVLRVAIQCTQAIQDMHTVGFLHRDIKPSNFSCGYSKKDIIYLFDFGLARQIMVPDKDGKLKLREPRSKVSFRGTVRYCSINVHQYREQGRHDDLISMLFMSIELLNRTLPWKGMHRKDSGATKETVQDKVLFLHCPPSFLEMYSHLRKLTYYDLPPYDTFKDLFKRDFANAKCKMSDPLDWMKKASEPADDERSGTKQRVKKLDEDAVLDKAEDTDTLREIEDSIESDASENATETRGFAKDDTLDEVQDLKR